VPPSPPEPQYPPAADAPTGTDSAVASLDLNTVTFEQLRAENLSVTQATRLLAHRERLGGFQSVDDLDQVAGFPEDVLTDMASGGLLLDVGKLRVRADLVQRDG
jgi:hypothetical protein